MPEKAFSFGMFPGLLFSDPHKTQNYTVREKRIISERYNIVEQKLGFKGINYIPSQAGSSGNIFIMCSGGGWR